MIHEVIDDANLIPSLKEEWNQNRSDISRTSCHQDFHLFLEILLIIFIILRMEFRVTEWGIYVFPASLFGKNHFFLLLFCKEPFFLPLFGKEPFFLPLFGKEGPGEI
jgi:hypothetical protein